MLSRELTAKTTKIIWWPLSAAPSMRYHLLHEPPMGGKPMMLTAPMKKAPKVKGITRPRPRMSLISVLWVAT